LFLRYRPVANDMSLWTRICRDWDTFYKIFSPLVCRNTKLIVKDEMVLPPQTKALLSIDFTAVEEINYQHVYEQMLDDCGLSPNGSPLRSNWTLDEKVADKLKRWMGITW
jgi:E3 ubiquitin-protein ligase SHPRH